eukprot:NODE_495_length_2151_cov_19.034585_g459_i0.p1 GENE.NODE_495_length_2151_cov_19.034585_g459_i0~~NODE_495_length_2151_cov_19.034585_g459_i0.p1  ORF type:complete len:685 (+),score=157.68 NODE_495_length_2151_cov_19.034585_g459_i0:66-2120(+)
MDTPPTIELEHAIGFSGRPSTLYYHPDGKEYIYVAGACVVIADLTDEHNQIFLRGHDDDITCLIVSKTGDYIISGQQGHNSDVCIWSYADQTVLFRLEEHDHGVAAIALTEDEKLLISLGNHRDRKLVVWDMSVGYIVANQPLSCEEAATAVEWGQLVRDVKQRETDCYQFSVIAGSSLLCYVLNPFTGLLQGSKMGSSSFVRRFTCLKYSSGGSLLLVGTDSGDVGIFSTKQQSLITSCQVCGGGVRTLELQPPVSDPGAPHHDSFQYARFGAHDRSSTFYTGGGDGSVVRYHIKDTNEPAPTEEARLEVRGEVTSISIMPSGLLAGTTFGSLFKLQSLTGPCPAPLSQTTLGPVLAVQFHPTINDRFATASQDAFIRVWETSGYHILSTAGGQGGGVARRVARQYGGQDIGGGPAGSTLTPGLRAKGMAGAGQDKPSCHPICFAYIGHMDVLISGWSDGAIRSTDATNGEHLWSVDNAHRCPITQLVIAPNMKFIVTGGEEGEIRLWEMKTREMVSELKEHKGHISGLRMFEDSTHLLSSSKDRSVITWDLMKERRVSSHEQRMGAITSCDLYRNQTNFVTVGQEKRISLWDLRAPTPSATVPYSQHPDSYATAVSLSHGNRFMATGGVDQVVKLWDASSLQLIQQGVGHSGTVNDLMFSPDDKQVVSVGHDSCVFIWNVYC